MNKFSKKSYMKGTKIQAKKSRDNAIKKYYENPKRCLNCDKIIDVGDKTVAVIKRKNFCSHKCSAIYSNLKRMERGYSLKGISKEINCVECQKKIIVGINSINNIRCSDCKIKERTIKSNSKVYKRNKVDDENGKCLNCNKDIKYKIGKEKSFCSSRCFNIFKNKESIKRWKSGEIDGVCGEIGTCSFIKKYIIEKRGNKCEECGWNKINPTTGKIPLSLHHIDGDWKNNKENNLKLLCGSCHSITPTYGSLNNGKGRKRK